MPYINIQVTGGAEASTPEKKQVLFAGATELVTRALKKNPATTFFIIEEASSDKWGVSGKCATERRKLSRATSMCEK